MDFDKTIESSWALEYSFNNNSYAGLPLIEILKSNMENFKLGNQHDYSIIAIFRTKDELEEYFDQGKIFSGRSLYEDMNGHLRTSPKQ